MDKGKRLDSWKEIAEYLNRNVRTCQAWERDLGLPVHRLDGSPKARVSACTAEIDRWREDMYARQQADQLADLLGAVTPCAGTTSPRTDSVS